MIVFNELRLNEDKSAIIVDCNVEAIDMYSNVYIKAIYLENSKNVSPSGVGTPSSKAIKIFTNDGGNPDKTVNALRLSYAAASIPDPAAFGTSVFDAGLFFIIVQCDTDGSPSPALINASMYVCGLDDMTDVGVVLDWQKFYQVGMQHAAYIAVGNCNSCDIPTGMEQNVLMWFALRYAIDTCDWTRLYDLWNKFLRTALGTQVTGGCGCGK